MAIEIVDLPIKKWWFSIVMLNYQRVRHGGNPQGIQVMTMTTGFLKQPAGDDWEIHGNPPWNIWEILQMVYHWIECMILFGMVATQFQLHSV
jgi:hypothetical protein